MMEIISYLFRNIFNDFRGKTIIDQTLKIKVLYFNLAHRRKLVGCLFQTCRVGIAHSKNRASNFFIHLQATAYSDKILCNFRLRTYKKDFKSWIKLYIHRKQPN